MADEVGAVDDGLRALSRFFVDEGTLGETLLKVAELACAVAPAEFAGITTFTEGRPATSVFTDPEAPAIDAAQYESGSGPCLQALRDGAVYRIDDTETDRRWEAFAQMCRAHGIYSTVSVPVLARGEGLAALNLYARRVAAFDEDAERRVAVFADQAAVVLANAQVYWDARRLNESLGEAMRSRATIDQAIGVLIAGSGGTPEDAFQLLVRASQRENRKLRDIATELVERAAGRRSADSSD